MRRISIFPLHLLLLASCAERVPDPVVHVRAESAGLSEPEFRFRGDSPGDGGFGAVSHLRVSSDGGRVFVLEPDESRLTAWTPGGRLLLDLGGRGEGTGGLAVPRRMHWDGEELCVADRLRFSCFASDGTLARAIDLPPPSVDHEGFRLRVDALLADGSFVGVPRIPAKMRLGLATNDPVDSTPLLRTRRTGDGWLHEPLFTLNARGATLVAVVPPVMGHFFMAHPYSTADRYVADPGAGTVLLARVAGRGLGPGEVELLEVGAAGDTLWRRRLAFRPVGPTRDALDATIDDVVRILGPEGPATVLPRDVSADGELSLLAPVAPPEPRTSPPRGLVEDALGAPEHLPALSDLVLASSGSVWLGTHERLDTLTVWYVMERGSDQSPPRPFLLPEWFRVMDATETHVWGVWEDELDISYVVGRRLVPVS